MSTPPPPDTLRPGHHPPQPQQLIHLLARHHHHLAGNRGNPHRKITCTAVLVRPLRCFGVVPERIDLFERDAARASTGNTGYIDLFWSGVVIGEAKSSGKDLLSAEKQALDYLAGGSIAQHEWPKYSVVTDFENLRVTKLDTDGWSAAFTIDELTDHIDQLIFLAGQETVTKAEEDLAERGETRLRKSHV